MAFLIGLPGLDLRIGMVLMATGVDAPIEAIPRSLLTEIAKHVCSTLRPTPLIPAHRTRVTVTWRRVAVTWTRAIP